MGVLRLGVVAKGTQVLAARDDKRLVGAAAGDLSDPLEVFMLCQTAEGVEVLPFFDAGHLVKNALVGGDVLHVLPAVVGDADLVQRDAELLADEEGVGFAGNADAQLVCGAQRLKVKFTAGIDDAFRLQSEDLQLCIVGGRHQQHTTAAQLLDDGDCQRSTLGGVCACSQLVQQDQCAGHGQFQDACDLLHVAGEGRQALFDALLVADVHEEFVKYADLAALIGGNEEAALCHGTQ